MLPISSWEMVFLNGKIERMPLTIDKAGRIVIPKPVRERFHLQAGDELELVVTAESLVLRPRPQEMPLRKERGVWVYGVGSKSPVDTDNLLDEIRERRARDL
jgi:AbrB family looped-hinge helix DNA binding protein